MIACIEFGESAPTLTLPRKRERGPTGVAARNSLAPHRLLCPVALNKLSTRQALLPLPLAREAQAAFGRRSLEERRCGASATGGGAATSRTARVERVSPTRIASIDAIRPKSELRSSRPPQAEEVKQSAEMKLFTPSPRRSATTHSNPRTANKTARPAASRAANPPSARPIDRRRR
jgi:hypothetical protein